MILIKINDSGILNIYDKSKIVLSCNYKFIGHYNIKSSLFFWDSFFNHSIYNTHVSNSVKLLNSSILSKKFTDNSLINTLIYYCSNPILYISQDNINNLLLYSLFITNFKSIVFQNRDDNIYYYIIIDILGT